MFESLSRKPCFHIGQPTVAYILPGIMIKLPVAIGQVLMSNPEIACIDEINI